jgi:hypothetical protein
VYRGGKAVHELSDGDLTDLGEVAATA